MIANKLTMNDSKTEFMVFRSSQRKCDLSGLSGNVGESMITQSSKVITLMAHYNAAMRLALEYASSYDSLLHSRPALTNCKLCRLQH